MSAELKPCPFCGGEAKIERKGTSRVSMQIACTQCNTHVESGDMYGMTPSENWQWNRRAHPPEQPAGMALTQPQLNCGLAYGVHPDTLKAIFADMLAAAKKEG